MSLLEKLSDGRHSVLGKLVSVLVTVVLICSFFGTPAFAAVSAEETSSSIATIEEASTPVAQPTDATVEDVAPPVTMPENSVAQPESTPAPSPTPAPEPEASDTVTPTLGAESSTVPAPGTGVQGSPSYNETPGIGSDEPSADAPEQDSGLNEIANSGNLQILTLELEDETTLTGQNGFDHEWDAHPEGIVTIDERTSGWFGIESSAKIKAVSAGSTTITHTYTSLTWPFREQTETFRIVVKDVEEEPGQLGLEAEVTNTGSGEDGRSSRTKPPRSPSPSKTPAT